jgi:hypothetical protein
MALVKLQTACTIKNKLNNDLYGEPTFSTARASKCGVVKLSTGMQSSTVRTDSGGTRGHANEKVADAKLLLLSDEQISLDDIVTVNNVSIIVTGIEYRYSVSGKIDHIEMVGTIE